MLVSWSICKISNKSVYLRNIKSNASANRNQCGQLGVVGYANMVRTVSIQFILVKNKTQLCKYYFHNSHVYNNVRKMPDFGKVDAESRAA